MIRRLSIFDTDEFIDIIDESFTQELSHMGEKYGVSKLQMRLIYLWMRLLQILFGDVRSIPDIFAYYDEDDEVVGVTKMIPINARRDHWYTEITAVREALQKRGVGSALKRHTVEHYTGKARRFFGNLREDNTASLKANASVGYRPYVKNIVFKKEPPHHSDRKEVGGFRHFKNDSGGVFDLYLRTTPPDIVKIEDKISEDFDLSTALKVMSLFRILGKDKRYVIEKKGVILGYFYFEQLSAGYENLEIMLDPQCDVDVGDVMSMVSPDISLISYVPEYRYHERECLVKAGFQPGETYLRIVKEF